MRVKHRHFRPPLRGAAVALTAGAAATVAVAWACATWAPTRVVEDPMDDPAAALETVDPDGARALHFRQRAFGWTYSCLRGERVHSDSRGTVHLIWAPPYGGVDHQIAGWPLPALRSRVEVLDSQGPGRSYVDGADPVPIRQRRRWELPADEIYHRGLASTDLPVWLKAQHGRRLPLVPVPAGFAINTLLYGTAYLLVAFTCRVIWRRAAPVRRGFPVLTRTRGPSA